MVSEERLKVWASILFYSAGVLGVTAQVIPDPTATVAITAAPPYSATGQLFILRSDTNLALLHDPVLVVEGFDIENSMNWPAAWRSHSKGPVRSICCRGRTRKSIAWPDTVRP